MLRNARCSGYLAYGNRRSPSMRQRVNNVIYADPHTERGESLRVERIVGVLPGVAQVHVVADCDHQSAVIVENPPPVRCVAADRGWKRCRALLANALTAEVLGAWNLVLVVEIEYRVKNSVLGFNV